MNVRGRARLRVAGLRDRVELAYHIEAWLGGRAGIVSVRASALTGNVLILFDVRCFTVGQLVADVVRCRTMAPPPSNGRPGRARAPLPPPPDRPAWHALPVKAVARRLRASARNGLSSREAKTRLAAAGPNRLPLPEPRSALGLLWDQVATVPVMMLGGAAALSLASGGLFDAGIILGVVALNATVGYLTERRVGRILASLEGLTVPTALVRRDGKEVFVPAAALVPGDVIILKVGYDVPADGRVVVSADGLSVNEAALTGESLAVLKAARRLYPAQTPLAERGNLVYAGTAVAEGSGAAIVTETGGQTEMGRIQRLVSEAVAPPTPLEGQLDRLGRRLAAACAGLCGVALGLGLVRGIPPVEMLRTAISLAVAAVPEGLPAVATTTLALGMQRMRRRQALVRRLAAVEGLGAATVICVDKTGTLTENRMTVHGWHLGAGDFVPERRRTTPGAAPIADPRLERALAIGALCNEADLATTDGGRWEVNGSSTEGALLAAAVQAGVDYRRLRREHPLLGIRPRLESENWMATIHDAGPGPRLMMVKGAPEEVLRLAVACFDGVAATPLTVEARRDILEANARLANQGMRLLGLAFRELEPGARPAYDGLTWVGLVALADPIRDGVREAIAACHRAGIRTVMMTGDQSLTALAVARELGLARDGQMRVIEASQLGRLDERDLRGLSREVAVFARVSPAHKHQIVRALQADGEVVAMTGDGINDGPALKAADIGVAMGARGTELARDLADVVLLDDDFGSVVGAVEQGRTIYANIRKALRFLLATNFSEILVTVGALALGLARPLSAAQLLWINLLSDVFPALALAMEPPDPEVMARPPRRPGEPILSRRTLWGIAGDGALIATAALGAYGVALARSGPGGQASTVAFTTLTSAQLLYALSCRSGVRSGLASLPGNPLLAGAVGGALALQVAGTTIPVLRRVLGTTPLTAADWGLVAGGAALPLLVKEATKTLTAGPRRLGSSLTTERRR